MLSCHWKESFWEWGCEAIRNHLSVSSKNFDAQEVCLFTSYDSILPFDIWYLLFVIWNLKFIFIFEIDWSGGNQVTQQTQGWSLYTVIQCQTGDSMQIFDLMGGGKYIFQLRNVCLDICFDQTHSSYYEKIIALW